MASNVAQKVQNIQATVTAAAATSSTAALDIGRDDEITVCINVTTATGTSPTLDIVMQHSIDEGTTYVNAPQRTAQITAAGVHYMVFRRGIGSGGEAAFNQAGVADTGGALAKNFVFDSDQIKFKYTIGGTNPVFTFTVNVFSKPYSLY
jgi:hypothetical protein